MKDSQTMKESQQFAETVILVDAAYLNRVVSDIAAHFSEILGRTLPKADLPVLLECVSLDAGVQPGEQAIQVLFIYDADCVRMDALTPSDLHKELHEVAFKSRLGEFSLYSFEPSGMSTREALFLESLRLVADAKETKRVIAIPHEEEYGAKVPPILNKVEGKEMLMTFGMNPPATEGALQWEMLGFAVLQALGIKGDEI